MGYLKFLSMGTSANRECSNLSLRNKNGTKTNLCKIL